MALIQLGGGVTDIRGSIGGTTFSRGPAGNYARRRLKPINPGSSAQEKTRAILSWLSAYWSKTLTEVQRTAWRNYAAATNFTNKLGQVIHINGMACFVRVNGMLLNWGRTLQATAPIETGHAGAMDYTFGADPSTQKLTFTEPTGTWDETNEDDYLYIAQARPMSSGRITSPSGWINRAAIAGAAVPPTWPMEINGAYVLQAGQQCAAMMIHQDDLGRVSAKTIKIAIAAIP